MDTALPRRFFPDRSPGGAGRKGTIVMAPKSVLSGDLGSFSLADVFTLLGMGKKGGVLRLTRGAETRTLHWEAGEIVFARSQSVGVSLGNLPARKGVLTPKHEDCQTVPHPAGSCYYHLSRFPPHGASLS